MAKPRAKRLAIYYGWTTKGKRIHLGDEVAYSQSKKVNVVSTFCGPLMWAWEDGSMPSPGQVQEFCRNCFRTLAWEAFEGSMLAESRLKEVRV